MYLHYQHRQNYDIIFRKHQYYYRKAARYVISQIKTTTII